MHFNVIVGVSEIVEYNTTIIFHYKSVEGSDHVERMILYVYNHLWGILNSAAAATSLDPAHGQWVVTSCKL